MYALGMRGILDLAAYVPYWRLNRSEIRATFGSGGGKGTRAVASFDEDTTTIGTEAARLLGSVSPSSLWFATVSPAYLDKTNATTIHAALRFDSDVSALDWGGSIRSGVGALMTALRGNDPVLVVTADIRDGLPTSADESSGGDAAAAIMVGSDSEGPLLAEVLGMGSATEEFIDRWRLPGDRRSKVWEERFGETRYVPLGEEAWNAGLKDAGITAAEIDQVIITSSHARSVRAISSRLGVEADKIALDYSETIGYTGSAHAGLALTDLLETVGAQKTIALLSLADGADVLVLRTTDAITKRKPVRSVATQIKARADVAYGKFLSWREWVTLEPPRRPEPGRISASISSRREDWKYGLVGSRDRTSNAFHLPPARVSMKGGAVDDMDPAPMAAEIGTIATFTIDRIAYSPSPPIVFAVIDFEGGGRTAVEMCDVDAESLKMGDRVEMTFRRLFTADGIHNYFWKARPVRDGVAK